MTSSKISRMPCLSQIARRRFEIALRRRQHAGRARHRLDDDGGDGRGIMQRDQAVEIVGEMRAPFGLALGEGLLLAIVGVRQMIDAAQRGAEHLAVRHDPAHRNAAEADAVIAALAPDQAHARGLAAHVVVGERDLERGVDRLRARIAEEHVIEIAGRERRDAARELERLRVRELERRRIIEFGGLLLDRLDDRGAVVAGIAAPHAGRAVEHGFAVDRVVMHVLGAHDQARRLLERAVRRERHPERLKIVRDRRGLLRPGERHGRFS